MLAARGLVLCLEGSAVGIFCFVSERLNTFDEASSMRPHARHHLGVQKDVDVVVNSRYFECAKTGKHIIVGIVVIFVRDQLAVGFLLEPGLGHLVHMALSVGDRRDDGSLNLLEDSRVLGFVVAGVPLMLAALAANFKHESEI